MAPVGGPFTLVTADLKACPAPHDKIKQLLKFCDIARALLVTGLISTSSGEQTSLNCTGILSAHARRSASPVGSRTVEEQLTHLFRSRIVIPWPKPDRTQLGGPR